MISKTKWIAESVRLSRKLVTQQWVPLLSIFIVSCMINFAGEDALQASGAGDETQRLIVQLLMGIWDMFEGVLLLVILSWGIPKVRTLTAASLLPKPFEQPYLQSFFAEYLRVLAQVLLWGLLLILPGFYRYCQLIFVPMITFFSKSYRDGDTDALQLSESLARGRLASILLLLFVTIGLQVALEFLPEALPDLHTLPLRILCAAVSSLISVWAFSLIFLLFEDAMEDLRPQEV